MKTNIKSMSDEELEKLFMEIQEELKRRKARRNHMVHVKFQSGFVDLRKGNGWAAILKRNDKGEIEREFIKVNKIWGKDGFTFSFQMDLPEGTVLEISEGGSWKNTYRYFCEVSSEGKNGLKDIGHYSSIEAKKYVFEKLGATRFARPKNLK